MASSLTDFGQIVKDHQAMVFGIAWQFLHDWSLAEDVAQEVFLQLHQHLSGMKSPEHLRFWLRKVTVQRCIDFSRKRKLNRTIHLDRAPEPALPAVEHDSMLSGRLRRLVASLPEKPRLVMILRYQEDLEPEEIAKVLEMPVRTVKSHLGRSLALLREKISRTAGEVPV